MKHIALFHSPCQDGLSSAWTFDKYMTEQALEYQLIPASYGAKNEVIVDKDTILYFLDFTFKRDRLIELANQVSQVIVIDHHKSAELDLVDLPSNVELHFDMTHSGAVLTWNYFYPGIKVPQFLRYIEDYDIWANKLTGTHEFFAWYTARNPETIQELDNLIADFPKSVKGFLASRQYRHGQVVMQYRQVLVNSIIDNPQFVTLENIEFVKFNSSIIQINSYLGNQAVAKYHKPAWVWFESIKDGKLVTFNSLRSTNELPDVSEIAVKMGGGGHRCAAGWVQSVV